jgi:thymidylate kinase
MKQPRTEGLDPSAFIVALEGPSYSGKTTLSRQLVARFGKSRTLVCPDYVEVAGGCDEVPRAPRRSVLGEFLSLRFFLNLDRRRWEQSLREASGHTLVILDRSLHTLLAHTFAIEMVYEKPIFERALKIVAKEPRIIPHQVLYLDAPQEELERRAEVRANRSARLFRDRDYNAAFREYFVPGLRWNVSSCAELDATLGPAELAKRAVEWIHPSLVRGDFWQ